MKTKLLRRIRNKGRNEIEINSITRRGDLTVGMSIGYDEYCYSGLFELGDTEEDVKKKALDIYLANNIERIRKRYKKYSVNFKKNKCN